MATFSDAGREALRVLLSRVEELQRALEDGSRRQVEREERMLLRIESVEQTERDHRRAIDRRVEEIATSFSCSGSPPPPSHGVGMPLSAASGASPEMMLELDDLQESVLSEVRAILKTFKTRHDDFRETTEAAIASLHQAHTASQAKVDHHIADTHNRLAEAQQAARAEHLRKDARRRKQGRGHLASDIFGDESTGSTEPMLGQAEDDSYHAAAAAAGQGGALQQGQLQEELRALEARIDARVAAALRERSPNVASATPSSYGVSGEAMSVQSDAPSVVQQAGGGGGGGAAAGCHPRCRACSEHSVRLVQLEQQIEGINANIEAAMDNLANYPPVVISPPVGAAGTTAATASPAEAGQTPGTPPQGQPQGLRGVLRDTVTAEVARLVEERLKPLVGEAVAAAGGGGGGGAVSQQRPPSRRASVTFIPDVEPVSSHNSPEDKEVEPVPSLRRHHSATSAGSSASGVSVSSKVSAKIRGRIGELEGRLEERMEELLQQNHSLKEELERLKHEVAEEMEEHADQILGTTALTLDRRLCEMSSKFEKEIKDLKESGSLCPMKGGSDSYANLKSHFDLRLFGEKVVAEWCKKKGNVLDELAANLVFPEGCEPREVLAMAAHRIQLAKGAAYPDKNSMELLVMALYTMAGPDIDALVGFEDVPVYDMDTKAEWDQYVAQHKTTRNGAIFSILNWASRTVVEAKGAAQQEAWASLRKWMKFFGLLLAMASEDRVAYPGKVYTNLQEKSGAQVTRQTVRDFIADNEGFRDKLGIYASHWDSGEATAPVTMQEFTELVLKSDPFGRRNTVARGITGLPEQVVDSHRSMGDTGQGPAQLYWPSPSSCAFDTNVSESYIRGDASNANKAKGDAILFIIKDVSFGLPLQAISQYPREAELLLPPLSTFEVVGVRPYEAGSRAIRMELKCTSALGSTALSAFCSDAISDGATANSVVAKHIKAYHKAMGHDTISIGSSSPDSPDSQTGSKGTVPLRERLRMLETHVHDMKKEVQEVAQQNSLLNAAVRELKSQAQPALRGGRSGGISASSSFSGLPRSPSDDEVGSPQSTTVERLQKFSQALLQPAVPSAAVGRQAGSRSASVGLATTTSESPVPELEDMREAIASVSGTLAACVEGSATMRERLARLEGAAAAAASHRPDAALQEQGARVGASEQRIERVEEELSATHAEMRRLREAGRSSEGSLSAMQDSVARLEARASAPQQQAQVEGRIDTLEQEVTTLYAEVRSAGASGRSACDRVTRAEASLAGVESQVQVAAQLEAQRRGFLEKAVGDFDSGRAAASEALLQGVCERVTVLEGELVSMLGDVRRLDVSQATEPQHPLQEDVTRLQEAVVAAAEGTSRSVAALEQGLLEVNSRAADRTKEMLKFSAKVDAIESASAADVAPRLAQAEAKLQRLSSSFDDVAARQAVATTTAVSEAAQTKAALEAQHSDLAAHVSEAGRQRALVQDMAAEVEAARRRIGSLEASLGEARERVEEAADLRGAVARVERRVGDALRRQEEFEEGASRASLDATAFTKVAKELRERLAAVEQSLEDTESRNVSLREREVASVNKRLTAFESCVKDIQGTFASLDAAPAPLGAEHIVSEAHALTHASPPPRPFVQHTYDTRRRIIDMEERLHTLQAQQERVPQDLEKSVLQQARELRKRIDAVDDELRRDLDSVKRQQEDLSVVGSTAADTTQLVEQLQANLLRVEEALAREGEEVQGETARINGTMRECLDRLSAFETQLSEGQHTARAVEEVVNTLRVGEGDTIQQLIGTQRDVQACRERVESLSASVDARMADLTQDNVQMLSFMEEDRSRHSKGVEAQERHRTHDVGDILMQRHVAGKLEELEAELTTTSRVTLEKVEALEHFTSGMHKRLVVLSEEHCSEWRAQALRIDRVETSEKALQHAFVDHQQAVQASLRRVDGPERGVRHDLYDRVQELEGSVERVHGSLRDMADNVEKLVHMEVLTSEHAQRLEGLTGRVDTLSELDVSMASLGNRLQEAVAEAVSTANIAYSMADRIKNLNQSDLQAITHTLAAIQEEKKSSNQQIETLSRSLSHHGSRLDSTNTTVGVLGQKVTHITDVELKSTRDDATKALKYAAKLRQQQQQQQQQQSTQRSVSPMRGDDKVPRAVVTLQTQLERLADRVEHSPMEAALGRLAAVEKAVRKMRDGIHVEGEPACKYDYVLTELSKHRTSIERITSQLDAVVMLRSRRHPEFPQRP